MVKLTPWILNLSPKGRSPLVHAWINLLFWIVALAVNVYSFMVWAEASDYFVYHHPILESLIIIAILFVFVISFVDIVMMQIRRLHDGDRSAVFWLVYLVPIVNLLALYWFYLKPGQKGANRYGPPSIK